MDVKSKIEKIEALIEGAKSDGERQAAQLARKRLQNKIHSEKNEYTIRLHSYWEKKLFVAICHKHDLQTYRYARQKHTTTMVQASKYVMDNIIWPEYSMFSNELQNLFTDISKELISKIHMVEEEETIISGSLL